ncbi:FAD-dependent oxidoreductase [Agreia bicolorata]|uniref:FAD-dependent oxidoreductase n=1 Tax=Agreia bicolorata TaxID=110935 RepID=A0ABR5CEE4_9MICO|nr:FAD-dependent oxidoreductase [Agreia bicolorata]KJC64009.1 FAD-dependent oxidoreductase [Agreia bicolorata]
MVTRADVVVVGGGAMGSAAAWQLARRGREVTLLERFGPGHTHGASHGASRNFNLSYGDDTYLSLLREALPLWRELEAESGVSVLDQVGLANHGANPAFDAVASALHTYGFEASFLTPEEAGSRWPGIRFDTRVLFMPQAGRLNADAAVSALQRAAASHGAIVRHHSRVAAIRVVSADSVLVDVQPVDAVSGEPSAAIETLDARRVVVTLGAWTTKLVGSSVALPQLVVSQEQPAHFAVRDATLSWPGFNHAPNPLDPSYDYWYSGVYGMFTPGQGVKAGWHGTGAVVDPDARTFVSEPAQLAALQRYAREWLPGADPDSFVEISCTYTTSPDSNFVVDSAGPLVVGAGFSGHGFKFTPAIGRVLADLVDGVGAAPALFSLAAAR